jgi:transglutaminase-like putative cysteine protease
LVSDLRNFFSSLAAVLRAALLLLAGAAIGVLVPVATRAQTPAPADEPVSPWHHYFEYEATPGSRDGSLPTPGRRPPSRSPSVSYTPDGPQFGPEVIPPGDPPPQLPPPTDPSVRLDDDTSAPDQLNYSQVFSPSIAPYKRLGVRDLMSSDSRSPSLVVTPSELVDLPVNARLTRDRQTFVGTMTIVSDGTPVAIPSPSPDLQVHQASTDTVAQPRFQRNLADQLFVILPSGTHELNVLVSSPLSYFGGPLPAGARPVDPREDPIFDPLADEVLQLAGTSRYDTDTVMVSRLARYLHTFQDVDNPADVNDNDLFLTLARRREGVCRHRAFIFVATLLSAGVPARYVFNEAHAFAEVRLQNGWRRVELGGAANALDVLGQDQNRAFEGPEDELLPEDPMNMRPAPDAAGPPSTQTGANAATGAEPAGQGHEPGTAPGGPQPHGEGAPGANAGAQAGSATAASPGGAAPPSPNPEEGGSPSPTATPELAATSGSGQTPTPAANATAPPLRAATAFSDVRLPAQTFRVQPFSVSGRLTSADNLAIAGATVTATLVVDSAEPINLGTATTSSSGAFTIDIRIPVAVRPGPAELRLSFAGDTQFEPAEY